MKGGGLSAMESNDMSGSCFLLELKRAERRLCASFKEDGGCWFCGWRGVEAAVSLRGVDTLTAMSERVWSST
jgi:hypothetical protein